MLVETGFFSCPVAANPKKIVIRIKNRLLNFMLFGRIVHVKLHYIFSFEFGGIAWIKRSVGFDNSNYPYEFCQDDSFLYSHLEIKRQTDVILPDGMDFSKIKQVTETSKPLTK